MVANQPSQSVWKRKQPATPGTRGLAHRPSSSSSFRGETLDWTVIFWTTALPVNSRSTHSRGQTPTTALWWWDSEASRCPSEELSVSNTPSQVRAEREHHLTLDHWDTVLSLFTETETFCPFVYTSSSQTFWSDHLLLTPDSAGPGCPTHEEN